MAFEIVIPQNVHDKVMHWVRKSDKEVSGFGKVKRDEKTGVFTVVDAYLIDQEVGGAHTDIDDKALSKLMYEAKDVEGDLAWWWHSHVDMSVFWSAQDKETILELGGNGWITASVFNKSEDVRSAVCYKYEYKSDFGSGTSTSFHDEVETTILMYEDAEEVARWDAEFDKKVRLEKTTVIGIGDKKWDYDAHKGVSIYKGEGKAARQVSEASVSRFQEEEYWEWGLCGYGLEAEAKALNMTTAGYYAVISTGDTVTLMGLENKLDAAVRSGKLLGEPYATTCSY